MERKSVYIKTFGCSLNQSDSEVMAGLLHEAGFKVFTEYSSNATVMSDVPESVDAVIINTCTVKNLSESKFFRELRRWQSKGAKIIVTGCIPQAEPGLLDDQLRDVSVIGTRQISKVVGIVNNALNDKVVHDLSNDYNSRLNLPKIRKTGIIEILPISEGCLSYCTYCKTRFARGELMSYPREQIIEEFRNAVKDGCREFWITSQDNGCYGFDIYRKEKYFLPQLLNDLLGIKGDFRIRLGMSSPDHVDRIKDELVQVFKNPKMFKFVHIPVQSGSNKVLRDMKRQYTIEKFLDIVKLFRKEIPEITVSTDIIAGFPKESDEEFNDTLQLIKNVKFDVVNLSRFWLRKGTDAEKLKQVYSAVSKSRSERAKSLFDAQLESQNQKYLGREFSVLIDEYGKNNSIIGRNDNYKQVIIKDLPSDAGLGDFVNVKIVAVEKYHLVGEYKAGLQQHHAEPYKS